MVQMGGSVKLAVSVIGEFMVTDAVAFGPVYDPAPLPVQPANVYPEFGVTDRVTTEPAL